MKKWLFTFLLLIVFPVIASHIVGGEFELLHISGNTYQLNMILYFDENHGNPGALDSDVTAYIFRIRDDSMMTSVFLPLTKSTQVSYTQPSCSHGEIKTKKLFYTTKITLKPTEYNDPQGYYVVWQRCCRQFPYPKEHPHSPGIKNIYSHDPTIRDANGVPTGEIDTLYAGQTFYLEFPPVVKNGKPFINSSPKLFPPLNDFASPGLPYYVDFTGVDDDGDSLVYTMVTPLNTTTGDPIPGPAPRPYPDVFWQPGYSLQHIMLGSPDLHISRDGLLRVTPGDTGLFSFAVKIEQFRNKERIGESRRDYQMLVIPAPKVYHPPQIVGKKLTDLTFTYKGDMSLNFSNTVTDDNRCIQVRVSDPDSQLPPDTAFVGIRVVPLNFSKITDISGILPGLTTAILRKGSTVDFRICFSPCPYIDGPFQIGIIAYDDACSLPLTDTLKVTVTVQPPFNTPPYFTTSVGATTTLNEGQSQTWNFSAQDDEHDTLAVYLVTDGFVLADAGMTFTFEQNQIGMVNGQLHWDAFCNIYDFTHRTSFQVQVKVDDLDKCSDDDPIIATYNLSVHLPSVLNPIIDTNLTSDPHEHLVQNLQRRVFESLSFDVTGTQGENDFIKLREDGPGLLVPGAVFPTVTGNGGVLSHFQWDINCNNVDLKTQDTFSFQFVVLDTANWCRFIKTDTVTVIVKVLPPTDIAPVLVIQNPNETLLNNNQLSITRGETVALSLLGTDADTSPMQDSLTLALVSAVGNVDPKGFNFSNAWGRGRVSSPFTWTPDCSIFENGVYQNNYTFRFAVDDNRCFNTKTDTVTLSLSVKDISNEGREFAPGNIITPNGDGCNDYFAVEGMDPGCGAANPDQIVSFPFDNCAGTFEYVKIHNRWGKQVFESEKRNFRWYATNESAGVYYYLIKFTDKEYKGVLSVRF